MRDLWAVVLAWAVAFFVLFLVMTFVPKNAKAAEFTVNPMKVEMQRFQKVSEIIISNQDKAPVRFQVKAFADGSDEETQVLAFYPKLFELKGGQKRVIRVGVRTLLADTQKYRIEIDEIPAPRIYKETAVTVKLRVIVPVTIPGAR